MEENKSQKTTSLNVNNLEMNDGMELVALLYMHEHLFLSLVTIHYYFMPITLD